MMIPVLAAVVALGAGVVIVMMMMGRSKGGSGPKRTMGRDSVIRNATKKLSQNPNDSESLNALGDLYFREEDWQQSFKIYSTLMENGQGARNFDVNLRYGISALRLGMTDDAYRGLSMARTMNQNNFDLNYNLGVLEFQRKSYDKAIAILNQARIEEPEHAPTLRTLGHAFFRIKKNKEAITYIRKAIDLAPDDKESLFTLGECYHEANQTEQALRIFGHIRGDPIMGASACLTCGTINAESRQYEKAVQDYELGLRHTNIKADVRIELMYRAAQIYLKINEIGKALAYLRDIQAENPNYKDVSPLISKYQELNANKNLQVFLMAPSGDFVALCRKIVIGFYQKAKVKIINITVNKNDWADILVEVDTPKWSDLIMFRFIRTQGSIGELIVRDFHSHLKEVKAGKGVCITVGTFTEEAKRYTEARLIDLIEKERFSALLNAVDARIAAARGQVKSPVKKAG
jgi:tetratricopeptide (TPR) repeat protein